MFSQARTPLYGFAAARAYELLDLDYIGHVANHFASATRRDLSRVEAARIFQQRGLQPEPFLHAVSLAMGDPEWSLERGVAAMLSPQARPWKRWFPPT